MLRRRLLAPALLAACFSGDALEGEPCKADGDCGPDLSCSVGGLCGEVGCDEPLEIALDNLDPDIFLVVDYAQTMDAGIAGTSTSRWDAVRALVQRITDSLGERANLGVQVVPSVDPTLDNVADPCFTSVFTGTPPAAAAAEAVLAALYDGTAKNGEHALRRGLQFARKYLLARLAGGPRPQAVVLISDGLYNCPLELPKGTPQVEAFDDLLVDRVAEFAARDIPVFVVGVGIDPAAGGEPPGPGVKVVMVDRHLAAEQLAEAGGRPRAAAEAPAYYTHADGDALLAALAAIPDAFADCRVALPSAPTHPQRLALLVDGLTFRPGDCADERGFRYVDDGHDRIELCPSTCARFRETRSLAVEPRCPSA
ncbi:MAG: hypothetical protein JNL82_35365 [Myxococcales bacterium]|nr:hypothetical protein [Myxococcales bacterium]